MDGIQLEFDALFDPRKRRAETIRFRRGSTNAGAALESDVLLARIYQTIRAWQIGKRASNLATLTDFKGSIRGRADEIRSLSAIRLGDSDLAVERIAVQVLSLIESLGIVDNETKLVAGIKTLHHLLPDLRRLSSAKAC